jgi:glutamine amidotransferase
MSTHRFPSHTDVNETRSARNNVVIIDYEFGNVQSVLNAIETLGANVSISRDEQVLRAADRLILPGVGAFRDGMNNLKRLRLIPLLEELVFEQKKPLLGICVGMQLMAQKGYEYGEYDGLGWIDADVVRFDVDKTHHLKVPHVGWNDVEINASGLLPEGVTETHSYYFVHSYYLQCRDTEAVTGICNYGIDFPAVIQKDNLFAVQFHPEKSQKHGLKLLENFLRYTRQPETSPC